MVRKIAVLTSGGDSPGMNAAIRGVVRNGISLGMEVYGVYHGYTGLINGDIEKLEIGSVADIIHRGGTILRTSRSEFFKTDEGRDLAIKKLKELDIDGLVVIGGDGSSKGAKRLFDCGISTVTIPGTIDNDIPGTEMTLGFDTAVNTAIQCIDRIRDTASSHERVYVIEVMGRSSGNLAISAGLSAGSESIIIPEISPNLNNIVEKLVKSYKRGKTHSTIIVAEGTASARDVAKYIEAQTEFETRLTVLGHIQRGGSPTASDRILGSRWGAYAAQLLFDRQTVGKMLGLKDNKIVENDFDQLFQKKSFADLNLYEINDKISI